MGSFFKTTRSAILANANAVADIMYTSTILLLHGQPQFADEVKEIAEKSIEVIEREDITIETVLHEEITKVIGNWLAGKDMLLRAAIERLFNRALVLISEKIDIDYDNRLSDEERQAWLTIFRSIQQAADLVLRYYSGQLNNVDNKNDFTKIENKSEEVLNESTEENQQVSSQKSIEEIVNEENE